MPIPHGEKAPRIADWQNLTIDRDNVAAYFVEKAMNVGVILGDASDGLTDVDVDCPEAERVAGRVLPMTPAVFGRTSKPRSHFLYRTDLAKQAPKAVEQFKDPTDEKMLLELRIGGAKGAQTVFPGSVHESAEPIIWAAAGDPEPVSGAELLEASSRLAAAALLGRHWGGPGGRNDHRMSLMGVLLRAGWSAGGVGEFVDLVTVAAGGDAELERRKSDARSAAKRIAAGETAFGLPRLVELVGDAVARRAMELLRVSHGPNPGPAQHRISDADSAFEDRLANELIRQAGERLRFDHSAQSWFVFERDHWRQDGQQVVRHQIRTLARTLGALKHVTSRAIAGAERLAQSDQLISATSEIWDADPFLLGAPGWTIDLHTGVARAARPEDFITKRIGAAPLETSDCPRWRRFLDEATGGDRETLRFLAQFTGYCLTGDTSEHVIVFLSGPPGTGKSTFAKMLARLLGAYAVTADPATFAHNRFTPHSAGLARLAGSRLVLVHEASERGWNLELIKAFAGGDAVAARPLYQEFRTFQPEAKLLFHGNALPALPYRDTGLERRLVIILFEHRPKTFDLRLEETLTAELPGILRWALDGLADWREHGLIRPCSAASATAQYFDDADILKEWFDACCEVLHGEQRPSVSRDDVLRSFEDFAGPEAVRSISRPRLYDYLRDRGITEGKTTANRRTIRLFCGLRLVRGTRT